MVDDEHFDMDASYAHLEKLGVLQTKASATKRAAKADKSVDRRSLRSRGRSEQINLKVTPAFNEMIRAKAAKRDMTVAEYVEQLVTGDKR